MLRGAAVPFAAAVTLFGALGFSSYTSRRVVADLHTSLDSARAKFEREMNLPRDLLVAGDTVPAAPSLVRTRGAASAGAPSVAPGVALRSAETVSMRDLARHGVRYFYFYRANCSPCAVLDPLLAAIPPQRRDSMAFVAYHPDSDLVSSPEPLHYAWRHTPATAPGLVRRVPSLIVVDESGRVVVAAHGRLDHVSKLLDLTGLVTKAAVDSSLVAIQTRAGQRDTTLKRQAAPR